MIFIALKFNFFCGLHSLVHFAETSNKSLIQVEDEFFDGDSPIHDKSFAKQTESGACRLGRTACKAFARGADEKNGCHIQFVTYISDFLKENKYTSYEYSIRMDNGTILKAFEKTEKKSI